MYLSPRKAVTDLGRGLASFPYSLVHSSSVTGSAVMEIAVKSLSWTEAAIISKRGDAELCAGDPRFH